MNSTISIRTGTISGMLLSLAPQVSSTDVIKTVLLAAIGATASFTVTLLWKWIWGRYRKK